MDGLYKPTDLVSKLKLEVIETLKELINNTNLIHFNGDIKLETQIDPSKSI